MYVQITLVYIDFSGIQVYIVYSMGSMLCCRDFLCIFAIVVDDMYRKVELRVLNLYGLLYFAATDRQSCICLGCQMKFGCEFGCEFGRNVFNE